MSKRSRDERDNAAVDTTSTGQPIMEIVETPAPEIPAPNDRPPESKADRFYRLASKRLPVALKKIEHLANLANAAQYESTPLQREYIVRQLTAAYEAAVRKYKGEKVTATATAIPK